MWNWNWLKKILRRPFKKTWDVKLTGSEAIACSKCGFTLKQNILKPCPPVCESCGSPGNWIAVGSD